MSANRACPSTPESSSFHKSRRGENVHVQCHRCGRRWVWPTGDVPADLPPVHQRATIRELLTGMDEGDLIYDYIACNMCGGDPYGADSHGPQPYVHEPWCPWVQAHTGLGLPLPDGHTASEPRGNNE